MPGTGADGARVSHLSRRELVCLGQEKLLEPEEREGWSWEGECEGPGEDWSPDQTQRTCLTALLFPCGAHPGGHRILTYSSLFTTPWPLGSNIRKALRMASSGSVPAGGGSQVNCQIPRL